MATLDNQKLKQVFLLSLILSISFLIIFNLLSYTSGFLGALTLYILFRNIYKKLVNEKGFKGWFCALAIILFSIIVILVPFGFAGFTLVDKITDIVNNPQPVIDQWNILYNKIHQLTGYNLYEIEPIEVFNRLQGPLSSFLPSLLGNTLMGVVNLAIMYFTLFFMFINGKEMENFVKNLFPMQEEDTKVVGRKAKEMIISNTIVIPLLAVIQGIFAFIGYAIFGVKESLIMAIITAIASVIPIVGTMIVWIPLGLILMAKSHLGAGIGLLVYGGVLISNIDYVFRLFLQKKIANVHPLITIIGIMFGVKIFGFVGLIFGPTLISILLLLIDLYIKEFTNTSPILSDSKDNT